jgi:hypothetical protein
LGENGTPKSAQTLPKINKFYNQLGVKWNAKICPNSAKNQQGFDSTWGKMERQTLTKINKV